MTQNRHNDDDDNDGDDDDNDGDDGTGGGDGDAADAPDTASVTDWISIARDRTRWEQMEHEHVSAHNDQYLRGPSIEHRSMLPWRLSSHFGCVGKCKDAKCTNGVTHVEQSS